MTESSARAWISKHVPLAEQPRQWSAEPRRRVRDSRTGLQPSPAGLRHGGPAFARWATAWRAISSGIGVERYTPVFQTGIEGALPSCPSISQANLARRQRPRTVEGACARTCSRTPDSVRLEFHFTRRGIPVPVRASQTWLRRFNSAFVSRLGCKHCSDAAVS